MTNLEFPKDREALADQFIDVLNELVEADRVAIEKLIVYRVSCNETLGVHPTVQTVLDGEAYTVGLLGILNGLVGVVESGPKEGWGFIAAVFDDDGKLVKFQRTMNAR
jgi:hypothetical protein